jgi:protein gp37
MNKQAQGKTRGIEWTDYTWNPVGGCKYRCRWEMPDGSVAPCYAELTAQRVASRTYKNGFAYHYWRPELLQEPLKVKTPAKIFLDSMSDLMGSWVKTHEIQQVLDICRQASQHQFQLLTKNAPRLLQFEFPSNVWVGVSAPPSSFMGKALSEAQQVKMVKKQVEVLGQVNVPVRWMSIEPLSFDIAPLLVGSNLQWAVIGAATNGPKTYQPEAEWVHNVLSVLDAQKTQVFFKGNLDWPEAQWREAFPAVQAVAVEADMLLLPAGE